MERRHLFSARYFWKLFFNIFAALPNILKHKKTNLKKKLGIRGVTTAAGLFLVIICHCSVGWFSTGLNQKSQVRPVWDRDKTQCKCLRVWDETKTFKEWSRDPDQSRLLQHYSRYHLKGGSVCKEATISRHHVSTVARPFVPGLWFHSDQSRKPIWTNALVHYFLL